MLERRTLEMNFYFKINRDEIDQFNSKYVIESSSVSFNNYVKFNWYSNKWQQTNIQLWLVYLSHGAAQCVCAC